VLQLIRAGSSEFHVAGAVQINGRLPMNTTRNEVINDQMIAAIDKSHQSICV